MIAEYRVVSLDAVDGLVEVTLRPISPETPSVEAPVLAAAEGVPSEEDIRRLLGKIKPVEKGSDEKQIVTRMVDAYIEVFKERGPELFQALGGRTPPPTGLFRAAPQHDSVLYVTPEQYEAMGSPPLLSTVKVEASLS